MYCYCSFKAVILLYDSAYTLGALGVLAQSVYTMAFDYSTDEEYYCAMRQRNAFKVTLNQINTCFVALYINQFQPSIVTLSKRLQVEYLRKE